MPLHLLSKKSWNVYAPANRARVARDEALAAAAQRDADREKRDHESSSTLEHLRRQTDTDTKLTDQEKLLLDATKSFQDARPDSKKRKKLLGEDDTDRDLRYAQERNDERHQNQDGRLLRMRTSGGLGKSPITDGSGHINLFPEPKSHRASKPPTELEKEVERQKSGEQNSSMHLKDALGYNPRDAWYLDKSSLPKTSQGTDVYGNVGPKREDRNVKRVLSADPLAAMQKAQVRLKEAKREKEERVKELDGMKRRARDGDSELGGFSLDEPRSRQRDRRRHSRSKSPRRKNYSSARQDYRDEDRPKLSGHRNSQGKRRSRSPRRRRE